MDELASKRFFEVLRKGQSFDEILTEYFQICLFAQKSDKGLESFNEKKQVETFQQESETWFLLQILLQVCDNYNASLLFRRKVPLNQNLQKLLGLIAPKY
jgi:hypothetical protein